MVKIYAIGVHESDDNLTDEAPDSIIQEFVRFAVQGVHEHRLAVYQWKFCIEEDHPDTCPYAEVCCSLCGSKFGSGEDDRHEIVDAKMEKHVRSPRHETRYAQLVQAQTLYLEQLYIARVRKCEPLVARAEWLGLPQWRQHVSELVTHFVETPLPLSGYGNAHRRWHELKVQLAMYEQMECLALFEQAMIKIRWSALMVDGGDDANSNNDKSINNNCDKMKLTARITCGVGDIVPLIVKVLGKPSVPFDRKFSDLPM
jgi:hypothetical protein